MCNSANSSPFWKKYHSYLEDTLLRTGACLRVDDEVFGFTDTTASIVTWVYSLKDLGDGNRQLETCLSHLETSAKLLERLGTYRPFSAYLAGSNILATAISDDRVLEGLWSFQPHMMDNSASESLKTLMIDDVEMAKSEDEDNVLIDAINRELYSKVPKALPSDSRVLEFLKVLVPAPRKHLTLVWGVMEQFIESAKRPFQIAPVMPSATTERAVVEDLISTAYDTFINQKGSNTSPDQVLRWIVKSLVHGQQKVLLAKSTRHGNDYYTVTPPHIRGVFVIPPEQREHPILDQAPRLAATLINLMMGVPFNQNVNHWPMIINAHLRYLGESAMWAAIRKGNVLYECVRTLSDHDDSLVAARVSDTLRIISGVDLDRPSILDRITTETFNKSGALDHVLKVRHIRDKTFVYSGAEDYVLDHNGRRIELGLSSDRKTVLLRWTDLVDRPPERGYYLDKNIMKAIVNESDNTVSIEVVRVLAREASVKISEIYFSLSIMIAEWNCNELVLSLSRALGIIRHDETNLAPGWDNYYDAAAIDGLRASVDLVRQLTEQYLLRALLGLEKRSEYTNSLDIGRRVFVIQTVQGSSPPHDDMGMLIYKESDERFAVVPVEAHNVIWSWVNNLVYLLNEERGAKAAICTAVPTIANLLRLTDAFTKYFPNPAEETVAFFLSLIERYRAHRLSGDKDEKLSSIVSTLLNGARNQPDLHRFACDSLFAQDGWYNSELKWENHRLGYASFLRDHFSQMVTAGDFWLGLKQKTNVPIAEVGADFFITFEPPGKVHVRRQDTLELAEDVDKIVQFFLNSDVNREGNHIRGSPAYISAVREGAKRTPPDSAVHKLPPDILVPCLNYAYEQVRSAYPDARRPLLEYVLRHFDIFCKIYNISVDSKPVVFARDERVALDKLRPFLERTFFERLVPASSGSEKKVMREIFTEHMTLIDISAPSKSRVSDKGRTRILSTPTCSFFFDDGGPFLCLLLRDATLYWYWSVLAMYHVAQTFHIGFLEMRHALEGFDHATGAMLVMYMSNGSMEFLIKERDVHDSVSYLGTEYALVEYTQLSSYMMDPKDANNFLPVLLHHWLEAPRSLEWEPYQRCLMWVSLTRALFPKPDQERREPILSYNVKRGGVTNTVGTGAMSELTPYGPLNSRGDGYGLLSVSDSNFHIIQALRDSR